MRNATSLLLTLKSYLIMLGTILILLVAAMPVSLRAQTNGSDGTNLNILVTAGSGSTAGMNSLQHIEPDHNSNNAAGNYPISMKSTVIAALPLLLPFAPFVAIVAVVFFGLYFKNYRNKLAHGTLRAMIEKGAPVTPELIASLNLKSKANEGVKNPQVRYLLPGLVLTGAGIGLMIQAVKPGLIVLLVGLAFLIVWLVEWKNKTGARPPQS